MSLTMNWNEMKKELKEKKKNLIEETIKEIQLDNDSAALLKLISDLSHGNEFIEADQIRNKLDQIGVKLFDASVTKAVETLYKKGYVKLGIALSTDSSSTR